MPWQQYVADVILEVDPETGLLWYDEWTLTVPRQSGKSTLLLPYFVWRAEASHLLGGRQRMFYAAQSKNDAVDKFDEEYLEQLAAAPVMRGRYRVTNHQGRKRIRFQSGSIVTPEATERASGHGKPLDAGILDEAFSQPDSRVEDAWVPAMLTKEQAQFGVTSTAGENKLRSPYLWRKVAAGRRLVERADPSSTRAYFEWSAAPGLDPEDPATWWSCMPALGHTQTERKVAARLQACLDDPDDGMPGFERGYLNRWADEVELERPWVFDKVQWFAQVDKECTRAGGHALSVDVAPDRRSSAISMTALRPDGQPWSKVVRHGPGVDWVLAEVKELSQRRPDVVVIDGVGPVSSMRDDLEDAVGGRSMVKVLTTADVADAFGQMTDALATAQWWHTGQTELDDAVAGATTRMLPGGRTTLDRRSSEDDITPIVAVLNSAYALKKWAGGPVAF